MNNNNHQTSIHDFHILSKIGKFFCSLKNCANFVCGVEILGTGAFSEVFKVSRKSDMKEYALKKVSQ